MKKIYIAHPLRGENREKNVAEVTKICKKITELFPDVLPVSPIHAFSFLDNCGAEGEKKALELCLELQKSCDEIWFFGNWAKSEGCCAEFDAAHVRRIYGPQDCEQIVAFPVEGNGSNLSSWLLESDSSELARWLLSEVYTEAEPLKPCPFCGGTPEVFISADASDGDIRCENKACPVTCNVSWGAVCICKTRAEAIAAWNRRAGE